MKSKLQERGGEGPWQVQSLGTQVRIQGGAETHFNQEF